MKRDITFSALYWVCVENIRKKCEAIGLKNNTFTKNIISGSIAGAIAGSITLPMDFLKTRIQVRKELEGE